MFSHRRYKGEVKLFGFIPLGRNLDMELELISTTQETNPYLWNSSEIKKLEPFLQKICTISWTEIKPELANA